MEMVAKAYGHWMSFNGFALRSDKEGGSFSCHSVIICTSYVIL